MNSSSLVYPCHRVYAWIINKGNNLGTFILAKQTTEISHMFNFRNYSYVYFDGLLKTNFTRIDTYECLLYSQGI